MDKEYQKKAVMKDLWNKEERVRELEKELSDVLDLLKKTQNKISLQTRFGGFSVFFP